MLTYKQAFYIFFTGKYDNDDDEPPMLIIDEKIEPKALEDSIGEIKNRFVRRKVSKLFWVVVETKPYFNLSNFILDGKVVNISDVNLVFYNSLEIKHSYLLDDSTCQGNFVSKNMEYFIQRVKRDHQENVLSTLKKETSLLISVLLSVIFNINIFLLSVNKYLVKRFDSQSFAIAQIHRRLIQVEKLVKGFNSGEDLLWKRIFGLLVVDVLLGFLSCYYIFNLSPPLELYSCFQSSVEVSSMNVYYYYSLLSTHS